MRLRAQIVALALIAAAVQLRGSDFDHGHGEHVDLLEHRNSGLRALAHPSESERGGDGETVHVRAFNSRGASDACDCCAFQCLPGFYYSNGTCIRCEKLFQCLSNPGRYAKLCDGTTTFDSTECTDCTAACLEGEYLSGNACPGLSRLEILENPRTTGPRCRVCTEGCREGQYLTGPPCSGTDLVDQRECKTCECAPGEFIENCDGTTMSYSCGTCQASCASGQYMQRRCTGESFEDTTECVTCKFSCGPGFYRINPCNGTMDFDTTQCVPCTCPPGYYVSGCPGFELGDPGLAACTRCRTSCPGREQVVGECKGTERQDLGCTPCNTTCDAGYFLSGENCSGTPGYYDKCEQCDCGAGLHIGPGGCNGRTSVDDQNCLQCGPVSCGEGYYRKDWCPGTTMSDTTVCTRCRTSCPAGQFVSGSCDGTSETDVTECRACTCEPGNYITLCDGTENKDLKFCVLCRQCRVGEYRKQFCNGLTLDSDPTECAPCNTTCPLGQWLDGACQGTETEDKSECKDCVCDPGTYISGCLGNTTEDPKRCVPCRTACPEGFYLSGECPGTTLEDKTCLPCRTSCPKGQYLDLKCAGTSDEDTTVCRDCSCPAGFFVSTAPFNNFPVGCDGTTKVDPKACAPCRKTCPDGLTLVGDCLGNKLQGPTCEGCKATCPRGSYLDGDNCTVTAGVVTATSLSTGLYTLCTKCTCPPETWIAGCQGSTTRDDKVCYDCIQKCPPGYTIHGECDGNGTQDRTCRPNQLTESLCDSRSVPDNGYLLQECRKHSRNEDGRCVKCPETCFGPNFVLGKCGEGEQPRCAPCRTSDCRVFLNFVVILPLSRGEVETAETTYLQAIANMVQVPVGDTAMLDTLEEFTPLPTTTTISISRREHVDSSAVDRLGVDEGFEGGGEEGAGRRKLMGVAVVVETEVTVDGAQSFAKQELVTLPALNRELEALGLPAALSVTIPRVRPPILSAVPVSATGSLRGSWWTAVGVALATLGVLTCRCHS